MTRNRPAEAIFGASLADAASLGLHWLYDPDRIAALPGPLAFRPPDPQDYAGAKGVFAHVGKRAGQSSHYGEQMRCMSRALILSKGYDRASYQMAFAGAFAPGGTWVGYVDKATRGTVARLATATWPSGEEDDQLPAIAKLPPLIAALGPRLWEAAVEDAVAVTSNHPVARAWAPAAAAALAAAMAGADMHAALHAGVRAAGAAVGAPLHRAMERAGEDPVAFAGEAGRACALPQGLPVAFHILARAGSYAQAIEENIRAGGDSCGRGIFIGAMAAAEWGLASIPPGWLLALDEGRAIWAEAEAVAALGRVG